MSIGQNMYTYINDDAELEAITAYVVQRKLNKLNIRKTAGHDNLSGSVV